MLTVLAIHGHPRQEVLVILSTTFLALSTALVINLISEALGKIIKITNQKENPLIPGKGGVSLLLQAQSVILPLSAVYCHAFYSTAHSLALEHQEISVPRGLREHPGGNSRQDLGFHGVYKHTASSKPVRWKVNMPTTTGGAPACTAPNAHRGPSPKTQETAWLVMG